MELESVEAKKLQVLKSDKHQTKLQHNLVTLGNQWSGGQDSNHKPPGICNAVESCINLLLQNGSFNKIVRGHKGFLDCIIA